MNNFISYEIVDLLWYTLHICCITLLYVPDEGSLMPKYRDCITSNGFELYIYIKCGYYQLNLNE